MYTLYSMAARFYHFIGNDVTQQRSNYRAHLYAIEFRICQHCVSMCVFTHLRFSLVRTAPSVVCSVLTPSEFIMD